MNLVFSDIQQRFGIDGALRFESGRAVISTPASEAEIYLQGAHITRWTPAGERPVLFLSSRSVFAPDKAIRGGVPIIFPWFGPRHDGKPGPAHGFARTMAWEVKATELHQNGSVQIVFGLETESGNLRFRVTAGQSLAMELEITNEFRETLTCQDALHTYLAVGDVREVSIRGLEGVTYIDKTDSSKRRLQGSEPIRFARKTDSVYLSTSADCIIEDPLWKRRIIIGTTGSESTVVWNPWSEKSAGMTDLGPDQWHEFVCVETANVADNSLLLKPGEVHTMTAVLRVDRSL